ncbi:head maturation protease, ClpP-related [Microbaculum marinum]|uniref:ATP-dependent Clp protease proteolytic subunit n=1 Tax=Microbaculum marinum TaxID=1764581 RepID=A0AAW9RSN3_9HYPH
MTTDANPFAGLPSARPQNIKFKMPSEAPMLRANADSATLDAFGPVGLEGFDEAGIAAVLDEFDGRDMTLRVNSGGGDYFAGVGIYNLLAGYPGRVTVRVMGLAASAASLLAMAGDEIEMGTGSRLMIHRAWAAVIGNTEDMEAARAILAALDTTAIAIYAGRSKQSRDSIARMMAEETWLDAAEAVRLGFADRKVKAPPLAGPKSKAKNLTDVSPRELERVLRDVGLSGSRAKRAASAAVKAVSPETQKIEAEQIAAKARAVAASLRR